MWVRERVMWVFHRGKLGYVISFLLGLMGIIAIWATLQRVWPQISVASDPWSTFLELLWTEKLDVASYLDFKLLYLLIIGGALLVVSVVGAFLNSERFYSPGKMILYHCPFCKHDWQSSGYLGVTNCPVCRQRIQPTIIEKIVA